MINYNMLTKLLASKNDSDKTRCLRSHKGITSGRVQLAPPLPFFTLVNLQLADSRGGCARIMKCHESSALFYPGRK